VKRHSEKPYKSRGDQKKKNEIFNAIRHQKPDLTDYDMFRVEKYKHHHDMNLANKSYGSHQVELSNEMIKYRRGYSAIPKK
jgi:hypothetical protein